MLNEKGNFFLRIISSSYLIDFVVFGNVAEEEEKCLQNETILVGYEQHHLLQNDFSLFWTYF
jgi:hypothetical protein